MRDNNARFGNFKTRALLYLTVLLLCACGDRSWNNPYPVGDDDKNILYSSFSERPKHLDPVRAYSSNEYAFIAQIYEPPLQYHYLKRPYTLIPLTAEDIPQPRFYDTSGKELPQDSDMTNVAMSVYDIRIKPGIMYQPHPAFALSREGRPEYHNLSSEDIEDIFTLQDFPKVGSREVTAADYVYQIKRMAHPATYSPIAGIMSEYIMGFTDYSSTLAEAYKLRKAGNKNGYLDLRQYSFEGVEVVDRYTYRIKLKGVYPQFVYWLSMPFFAPMPVEADQFYSQAGMEEKNITLDWYPIGSGPYMLTINNPNLKMVLEKNPNFRGESYPVTGDEGDSEAGLLDDAGKTIPFIDKVVYNLEKETIPYWNKFLQGYYDTSGISSDSFDQAIQIGNQGEVSLTGEMKEHGIKLRTTVTTSTFYFGFNMKDPKVGGLGEKQRKLRQAISIAINYEEYISIFQNGRGIAAQGPLPPGIFGYREGQSGINPYVYDWVDGRPRRKSIEYAKQLLAEAGYPDGISEETANPLLLHFDVTATDAQAKARLGWYRKQFKKLNIEVEIRNTDYNRFQEKMFNGKAQMFVWGWNADYPDPENFLFLLYGPNGKVDFKGENASNYASPEFDQLFDKMKNMHNGQQRQLIINNMMDIVQKDSPWIWGFHPKQFSLYHEWYKNAKPNLMANNSLKYKRVDSRMRKERRREWNQPVVWPIGLLLFIMAGSILPAIAIYRRKEHLSINEGRG
ncbi:MAG: ABC transporter substrate-binding protein [Gammaproteobacteria bacterium]